MKRYYLIYTNLAGNCESQEEVTENKYEQVRVQTENWTLGRTIGRIDNPIQTMQEERWQRIGQLMDAIKETNQYVELSCNFHENATWSITGYCGYEASRMSNIEENDAAMELLSLLDKVEK